MQRYTEGNTIIKHYVLNAEVHRKEPVDINHCQGNINSNAA